MSFKFLSGDFLSEYNKLLDEYRERQNSLDADFNDKIGSITARERMRLNDMMVGELSPGTKVKTYDGKIGIVTESVLEFETRRDGGNEWGTKSTGPERYWPIENENDEAIVTCDGALRSYKVAFEPGILERDWGIEQNLILMWEDEFEVVECYPET